MREAKMAWTVLLAVLALFCSADPAVAQRGIFNDPLDFLFHSLALGVTQQEVYKKIVQERDRKQLWLGDIKLDEFRNEGLVEMRLNWRGEDILQDGGPWAALCIKIRGGGWITGIHYQLNYRERLIKNDYKGEYCWVVNKDDM